MSFGWVLSLIAVLVVGSAVLAAFGFRGRSTTIGVDLGTTFSVVGIRDHHGKVTIVKDKLGNSIFPSVIAFSPDGKVKAACYQALPYLQTDPANTIYNAKRFIGRSLDDPIVLEYAKNHPFRIVRVNSSITPFGEIGFSLSPPTSSAGHASKISSTSSPLPPRLISPEYVGTQVLLYLKKLTSEFLGHSQVNKAVIAVPAKFTKAQREATAAAYKAAGLKVVRVLEEPTAAAVAYQLHKKSNIKHILVYDWGGGTLDVSLLFVNPNSVEVCLTK